VREFSRRTYVVVVAIAAITTFSTGSAFAIDHRTQPNHKASASSPGPTLKKFKKCRRGKPLFQYRVLSPTPVVRYPKLDLTYVSDVPEVVTPVKFRVQAKSCRSLKKVGFFMDNNQTILPRKKHKYMKMKAGKTRNFDYKVAFSPPSSDTSDPTREWGPSVVLRIFEIRPRRLDRQLGEMHIEYRYTQEQLAAE
jgi:hypothetical protein